MIETRFKKTIFGSIPKDWLYCTFGDVLQTFSSGATPYRGIPDYYKGNIRWISSGELNYNRIYDTVEHISEEAKVNTHLKLHSEGTFLMAITGLEADGTRGRCAIVGAPSTTNQSCLAINGTDRLSVDFLFWFYCYWSDFLAFKYCQGSKQQSYTANIVKKLPIYFPLTICEQQRIATALSDIDALLSALTKKIEKKKLIKQGAMQQLLTGKKRLAGFTELWEEKRLEEVCCNSAYGVAAEAIPYNGIDKYIRITDISDENGRFIPSPLTSPSFYDNNYVVQENDLLIARTGASVGKTYLYVKQDGRLIFAGFLMRINITNAHSKYVFYQTQTESYKKWINSESMRSGQPGLNMQQLLSYIVAFPPSLAEQSAIATLLSDMDKEIEALEAKRTKYTQVKQGMMQQLLTGKIRLVD